MSFLFYFVAMIFFGASRVHGVQRFVLLTYGAAVAHKHGPGSFGRSSGGLVFLRMVVVWIWRFGGTERGFYDLSGGF